MSLPKIMAIRMGVYCVLIGYLICDFFVFKGPLYRTLNTAPRDEKTILAEARASGVVARVYSRPIYRAQIEERIKEYLWRRGRTFEKTSASERRMLRELTVNQLIDDELLKLQIKVSMSEEVAIPDEEVARAWASEENRHPHPKVTEILTERAGWAGDEEREMRLAARLQRADYLRNQTGVAVTEDEARTWYQENEDKFSRDFEEAKGDIVEALELKKRDAEWRKFRVESLRRYAEGKIELFEEVLYAEK